MLRQLSYPQAVIELRRLDLPGFGHGTRQRQRQPRLTESGHKAERRKPALMHLAHGMIVMNLGCCRSVEVVIRIAALQLESPTAGNYPDIGSD
jgi:hypothetical protein